MLGASVILDRAQCEVIQNPIQDGCRIESGMTISVDTILVELDIRGANDRAETFALAAVTLGERLR
jgi:hypothetical protein